LASVSTLWIVGGLDQKAVFLVNDPAAIVNMYGK
jgi:hypothetical protein